MSPIFAIITLTILFKLKCSRAVDLIKSSARVFKPRTFPHLMPTQTLSTNKFLNLVTLMSEHKSQNGGKMKRFYSVVWLSKCKDFCLFICSFLFRNSKEPVISIRQFRICWIVLDISARNLSSAPYLFCIFQLKGDMLLSPLISILFPLINIFSPNFTPIYSVFKSNASTYSLVVSVAGKGLEVLFSINSAQVLSLKFVYFRGKLRRPFKVLTKLSMFSICLVDGV